MISSNNSPILIGYGREGTFAHIVSLAKKIVPNARILDLNKIETCNEVRITSREDQLLVDIDEQSLDISSTGIYYRGFYRPYKNVIRSQLLQDFLSELESALQLLSPDFLILNRPLAGTSNSCKLAHVEELGACGFQIPKTIVSNLSSRIEDLIAPNNAWISKGCSGMRTVATSIGGIESSRFSQLQYCPSLFQERVQGFDVRAHIINNKCVALKIETNKIDYRYAKRQGGTLKISEIELPASEKYKAIEFMNRSGLNFAGFDFKVDGKGAWWLLEANPMPGFEFFDDFADNKIGKTILEVLQDYKKQVVSKPRNKNVEVFIEVERVPEVDKGL